MYYILFVVFIRKMFVSFLFFGWVVRHARPLHSARESHKSEAWRIVGTSSSATIRRLSPSSHLLFLRPRCVTSDVVLLRKVLNTCFVMPHYLAPLCCFRKLDEQWISYLVASFSGFFTQVGISCFFEGNLLVKKSKKWSWKLSKQFHTNWL